MYPEIPVITPEQLDHLNELLSISSLTGGQFLQDSDPIYDQRVQDVLDEYWPGTTDLDLITGGDDYVYKAMYEGSKVIVKSTPYSEAAFNQNLYFKDFLNFM